MPPSKAALVKIHIARKDLKLTDETYRDILWLNFKVESSKNLNDRQVMELLDIFKGKGWAPKKATGPVRQKKRDGRYIEIQPGPAAQQQKKVLAMWNELGYGLDKLHARVKKQFGLDRFEWLVEGKALHVMITDLQHRLDALEAKKK